MLTAGTESDCILKQPSLPQNIINKIIHGHLVHRLYIMGPAAPSLSSVRGSLPKPHSRDISLQTEGSTCTKSTSDKSRPALCGQRFVVPLALCKLHLLPKLALSKARTHGDAGGSAVAGPSGQEVFWDQSCNRFASFLLNGKVIFGTTLTNAVKFRCQSGLLRGFVPVPEHVLPAIMWLLPLKGLFPGLRIRISPASFHPQMCLWL